MDPSRASIAVTTYSEEGGARGMEEFFKLAERGEHPCDRGPRVSPRSWP